jgi:CubicO group peptidase (beta-lactamase class C family)
MQKVKEILDEWTREQIFPGASVLVQQHDKILFEYASGYSDLESKIPATTDDIWVVASLAKPVATAAFMQLVDQRKLDLEQRANDLLPEFFHTNVTIRHLLTHTSGIIGMQPYPWPGNISAIARKGLLFEPGSKCSYTTPAFDLVEQIVCKLSAMTWPDYTQQNLFEPLGMLHSSYRPPNEWEDRIPKVYDLEYKIDSWWNHRFLRAIGLAGGGLYSTLRDMASFGQAFLNEGKPILRTESCRQMTSVQTQGLFNLEGRPQTWGLGFYLNQDDVEPGGFGPLSKNSFGHGGVTGTWFCVDPERKLIIVQMGNRLYVPLEDHCRMQNRLITTVLEDLGAG